MTGEAPFVVTFFADVAAATNRRQALTLRKLADRIARTSAPAKDRLPWLKLASFGDVRSPKGSLRHDANMLAISGIEADYDREELSVDDAVVIIEKAGLEALIYTSPSHLRDGHGPRWRILCPISQEYPPAVREHYLSRLAGLFRDGNATLLAPESWTLSQAYYFGAVDHNPAHRVEIIEGETLDELDDLDLIALGKPGKPEDEDNTAPHRPGRPQASIGDIRAALKAIPNNWTSWERWNTLGMAIFAASGGAWRGYRQFSRWSRRNKAAFDKDATKERWRHWQQTSPPARIGFGSLMHWARRADPNFALPSDGTSAAEALAAFLARQPTREKVDDPSPAARPPAVSGGGGGGGDGALSLPSAGNNNEQEPGTPGQSELDALIDQLNRRFALVNEAGKAVIYQPAFDPMLRRQILLRLRTGDFKTMFSNRRLSVLVQGAFGPHLVTRTWAEWWLRDLRRRQYLGGVVCDPSGHAPATCWNLYTGLSITPAAGGWQLMREHIEKVICSNTPEWSRYLLDTLARMFKHPEKPGEVAIVLRGKKGSGKGILLNHLKRAWGQHGIHIANPSHLTGNFNAHLRDCIMLFADEAFFANDRRHESVLKALITEPTLPIEGKYQNVVEVVNLLHVFLASNSDWVIPASMDERRFFVLDVLDSHLDDPAYFAALVREMEEGGLSAMIWDLLRRDLDGFDPRSIPETAALRDQKSHSLDSLQRWWLAVLERGFLWKSRHGAQGFRDWQDFYTTELLWRSYLQWCAETRPFDRRSRVQLGKFMTEIYQATRPRSEHPVYELDNLDVDPMEKRGAWLDRYSIVRQRHCPGYQVNTLEEARVRFTEICDIDTEWGLNPGDPAC